MRKMLEAKAAAFVATIRAFHLGIPGHASVTVNSAAAECIDERCPPKGRLVSVDHDQLPIRLRAPSMPREKTAT